MRPPTQPHRLPRFAAALFVLLGSVRGHAPGDFSSPPPSDQAFVQSFTFELAEEEPTPPAGERTASMDDVTSPAFVGGSQASERWFSAGEEEEEPMGGGLDDNEYFAVVSTESVYNNKVTEDQDWDVYRDAFLASWREFMFEQREMEDDDEDDEDDNNDGDGSCSILSNAAVYRSSKARDARAQLVAAQQTKNRKNKQKEHKARSRRKAGSSSWGLQTTKSRNVGVGGTKNQVPSGLSACLGVRGGAAAAASGNVGSEFMKKLFVSALVTLLFEFAMGHVLEFLKIDMQTSTVENYTYKDSIQKITSEKGVTGLWDGFVPWGVVQAIFKGSVFGLAHAIASQLLIPVAEDGLLPMQLALCLAGGIAGGFQGYVLSPTLLLKTRVMTDTAFREKMTLARTLYLSATIGFNVVKTEGMSSLMKGANVFATKRVFDWATRYLFADLFEAWFSTFLKEGDSLSLLQKSCASLLGGVFSTCSTLPLDVLVAKMQDAKKAGESVSAVDLFKQELESKGWKGLRRSYLRGFEARLAHVCLTVVVLKTFAPVVYKTLFG